MAFGDLSNRYVTGMGNTNVIDDNTDSMHTGIIQYLNAAAAGNYVFNGMTISQSDAGTFTRFTVSAGSYFKNHVRQSFSQATKDLDANFNAATYTYYIFLVVDSSGTLQFRGTEAEGASETDVGDLSDGDVPIALIEINKNAADNATDRKIQYYGATAKDRGFSVTDSSGAEVLKLNTDGTIVKGSATLTLPSSSTTLVGTDTTDTLTNKTISGSSNTLSNIPTSALASSTFTISDGSNTSPVALSETLTIRGTTNEVDVVENNKTVTVGLPSTITANVTGDVTGDLTGNADTATLATKATGLNTTSNGIVKTTSGDGTISVGSLVSGDIPNNAADTSGNAATATALATPRAFSITGDVTANAVNFDGTGVVTLNTAMANDSVELGTHTTGSYVAQGQTLGSGISGSVNSEGGTFTVTSNATSANTASTIVFRDTNGDFNAGTITASLTGNVTGNVTGTVSDISNHDTGDLAEGTNKYLTLANLKPILNATLSDLTIGAGSDTITIPGDLVVTGTTTTASVETVSTSNGVVFEGPNANDFETTLVGGNASSDITITLPTTTGTIALTTSDISGNAATATKWANARSITLTGDVTGTVSIDGSTNVSLATTIAGDSVALGTDTTGNYVTSITNGNYLTGGNGGSEGAELTIGVDATNLNTASKVVARDASGNFSAGTITADLTGDVTGNADTATQVGNLNNHNTGALSEGSNLYHTTERVQDVVGGQFVTNGSHTNITASYDDDGDGAIDLSIADSTIRGKISVTDSGGDGSLSYNNGTGVITYTGPSASETRAHFSAGTGVTLSSGEISIGQAVGTSSNVQFGTITGSSIVKSGGTSSQFLKADGSVDSSTYLTAHPTITGTESDDTINDSVSASLGVYVTGITVDQFGHITATSTANAVRGITAGNLIDTSNSNQQITIDVDLSELPSMSGTDVNKTQDELVILDQGSQKRKLISEIPISSFNNDGSALNPANFSTITSFDASNDKFVISDASASNAGVRILASNIPLSAFSNDSNFSTTVGTVTSVIVSGSDGIEVDSGSPITSSGTIALGVNAASLRTHINVADGATANTGSLADQDTVGTSDIDDDAVTYAKIQNVSATNRVLGRDTAGAGVVEEITPANLRTMINVEDGADVTNATNVAAAGAIMDGDFTSNGFMKRTGAGTYAVDTNTYLTAHPTISGAASSSDNSGRTYIQDITLDSNGHVIGIATATETVTDTNTQLSDSQVETAYNNQVSQVSSAERTSGTATGIRRYAPADIKSMIDTHQTDTVYSHPSHDGDDIDIDTGALTGATVISDLDLNVTTDTLGHVTDANATVSTRTLTLANLGFTGDSDATDDQTAVEIIALLNSDLGGDFTIGNQSNDTATFTGHVSVGGNLTVTGTVTTENVETVSTSNGVVFEGSASNDNEITLKAGTVSADRTITLPDATGTVLLTDGAGTALTALNATQLTTGNLPVDRIVNGSITESKLDINNTRADGYLLSWNNTAQAFSWVDPSTAGSSNQTITTGDGLTGANSGSASNITIAVGAGTGIDVGADAISVDVSDFMTNGVDNRILTATGTDAMNAEANLTFDGSTLDITGALTASGNISITGSSKIFVDNSQIWDDGANFKLQGNTKTQYQVLGQYGSHIFYTQDGSSSAPNNHTEVFNIAWTGDVSLGNNRDRTVSNSATAHDVAGKSLTISGGDTTAGTTDNIAGGDLILQGGQGKGTGAGGSITFQVADGGSTGSTLNSLSTAMTIADDGKVGIGTTTPDQLLHVVGSANDDTVALFSTTGGTGGTTQGTVHIGLSHFSSDSNPSVRIGAEENGTGSYQAAMTFGTRSATSDSAPTERMRITHDGKVGIGVTPTTTLLEIGDGTDKVSIDPTFVRVFNDNGSGTNATVQMWAETWGGKVGTTSSDDFLLYAHNAERVKFDGAYRSIFYGSTSTKPTVRLTTKDTTVSDTDTLGIIEWTGDYDSDGGDTDLVAASISAVAEADFTATANTTALVFNTATSEAASEKMRITNDGKVGIGTTSPSTNLHISDDSTSLITGLLVENVGSAGNSATVAGIEIKNGAGTDSSTHIEQDAFGQTIMYTGQGAKNEFLRVSADAGTFTVAGDLKLGGNDIIASDGTTAISTSGADVSVVGAFSATTKSFDIEHPTKEGMRLHHGSLEGPEHGVYIRGRLEGNEIDLPDYWLGLVDEDTITVQLTPNKGFQQIYVEDISDNKVYVGTQSDKPIDCFYFIQAERKDVDKMEVEY